MSTRRHGMEQAPEAETDAAAPAQELVVAPVAGGGATTPPRLGPGNAAAIQRAIGNAAMVRVVAQAAGAGLRPTLVEAFVELGPDVGSEASPDGGPLPAPAAT